MEIVKFSKDSSFQRIKASYLDDNAVVLTDKELVRKERLAKAWGLRLNNKYSTHQVIQILRKDFGISQATAYRDYNWAMQIYGDLDAVNLAAEKQILKEAFWNEYQIAKKKGDGELALKALKEYRGLFDFSADENQIDPNKIQAHEYHIQMPRSAYKKMDAIFKDGVVDFNNIDAEDIDYKEINDTNSDEQED